MGRHTGLKPAQHVGGAVSQATALPSRRELRAARRHATEQAAPASLPSRRELREARKAAEEAAVIASPVISGRRRARRLEAQVSFAGDVQDRDVPAASQAVTASITSAPIVAVMDTPNDATGTPNGEERAPQVETPVASPVAAEVPASHATFTAGGHGLSLIVTEAPAEPPQLTLRPVTAETPATATSTLVDTAAEEADNAPIQDALTERIEALPAMSPRAIHGAQTLSRVRMQARASMAVATSIVVGFGAAGVIAGAGQSAAAVTGSPVVSSLGQDVTVDATVPVAFVKNAEAADIDRVRGARELAESAPAMPAVCTNEAANGLTPAMTESSNAVVAMPVREGSYRISSGYGNRWNPIAGGYQFHLGLDFAAELSTPIHAIADGTVEYVGPGKDGRSSNLVIIRHDIGGDVFWSWYVHMYDDGIHVAEGDEVEVGQHVADVGNNGRSTGPHLHLEIHTDEDGTTVDPMTFLVDRGAREVSDLCS